MWQRNRKPNWRVCIGGLLLALFFPLAVWQTCLFFNPQVSPTKTRSPGRRAKEVDADGPGAPRKMASGSKQNGKPDANSRNLYEMFKPKKNVKDDSNTTNER